MTTLPQLLPPLPTASHGFVRIEYLGFQNFGEDREFRLRVCEPSGATEFLFRIAMSAFGAQGVRMQDGPDVCYQRLVRAMAAGGTTESPITIGESELAEYRAAHLQVSKHKSWSPAMPGAELATADGSAPPPPRPTPRRESAVLATVVPKPAFEEGQRVHHAVFGPGVTSTSTATHTVVHFDQDGPRRFVTRLLEVDVLTAPHTWETAPRGKNRVRKTTAS